MTLEEMEKWFTHWYGPGEIRTFTGKPNTVWVETWESWMDMCRDGTVPELISEAEDFLIHHGVI